MSDDRPNIPGPGLDQSTRNQRRHEQRQRRRNRRLWIVSAAVLASIAAIVAVSAGGGSSKGATHTDPASSGADRISGASDPAPTAIVSGGPLAPRRRREGGPMGAPQRGRLSTGHRRRLHSRLKLAGLPGYLLIADRANNRILIVNPAHQIVFKYPSAADLAAGHRLYYRRHIRRARWPCPDRQRGGQQRHRPGQPGRPLPARAVRPARRGRLGRHPRAHPRRRLRPARRHLHRCRRLRLRIIFVRHHRIVRQLGTSDVCTHEPPRYLDAVNGDTPMPGGAPC